MGTFLLSFGGGHRFFVHGYRPRILQGRPTRFCVHFNANAETSAEPSRGESDTRIDDPFSPHSRTTETRRVAKQNEDSFRGITNFEWRGLAVKIPGPAIKSRSWEGWTRVGGEVDP